MNTVVNVLISAVIGGLAIVLVQEFTGSVDTSGWSSLTSTIYDLIAPAVGIVVIVGLFLALTRIRGAG
jgi:uncharacterized membrane protein